MFEFVVVIAIILFGVFIIYKVWKEETKRASTIKHHEIEIKLLKDELESLKKKYEQNPSYETQLMMADILSGNALFRIERLETQNLFIRRPT